jgi:DNA mismatch repair protein MutL
MGIRELNVYSVLSHPRLLVTREALEQGGMNEFELQDRTVEKVSPPTSPPAFGVLRSGSGGGVQRTPNDPTTTRPALQRDLFRSDEEVEELDQGVREFQSIALRTRRMMEVDSLERPKLWQLHNKYILAEVQSGLVIVDQHVAHERILYEQALATFQGRRGGGQQVLFPNRLRFDPEDLPVFEELAGFLQGLGYDFQPLDKGGFAITAVPADIRQADHDRLIHDIVDQYNEYRTTEMEIHDAMAASFACKAAVKAGEPLTEEEMRSLLDQLFACEFPYACPHGRPVIMNLTLKELDKRFGRI